MCRRHITHAERRREDLNSKLRQNAIHTALINNYYGCYNILHSSSYLQMRAITPWCKLKHKSTLLIDQEVVFDHIYTFEPILLHPSAQQGSRRSKQRESSRLSKGYPRLAHVWGVSLQLPTLFFHVHLSVSACTNVVFVVTAAVFCLLGVLVQLTAAVQPLIVYYATLYS
jgi:hypothetical protein